jgi:putative membrane-bound dehydrogenase-like protein
MPSKYRNRFRTSARFITANLVLIGTIAVFVSGGNTVRADGDRVTSLDGKHQSNNSSQDPSPGPQTPEASLQAIEVRPGFAVELVAAEPLVRDPVAFEWDAAGRLWVAEMADYPVGIDGQGSPGGRINILEDTDGDGRFDKSTIFLDGVSFPSGVLPYKQGVLVTAAPEILHAADTNGDGRADQQTTLYAGFGEGNQQHRVNGFTWGLDNWIHCANGDSGGQIRSLKTGRTVNIRRSDLRIRPHTGDIETELGSTQFGRSRDDWGNWFGNNNSNPMWHYVLDDRYLRRNPHAVTPAGRRQVSTAPGPSRCYPISRPEARYNDLHMAGRFTSACSAIIYRDDSFGPDYLGNFFVSEPVHNLVHREIMSPDGVTFTSRRANDEQESEFLASRDNWFRPTMLKTGPDGALYIADMYRKVIEHTQYIPVELQKGLDVRAGEDRGRIYRVVPVGKPLRRTPLLGGLASVELAGMLDSANAWQRDTVQRMLVERQDRSAVKPLRALLSGASLPQTRLQALCTLDGLGVLKAGDVESALDDTHAEVRRHAVRLSEPLLNSVVSVRRKVLSLIEDKDPRLQLQEAYSLGAWDDPHSGVLLAKLALRDSENRYLTAAVISSLNQTNIAKCLETVLADQSDRNAYRKLVRKLLSLAAALGDEAALQMVFSHLTRPETDSDQIAVMLADFSKVLDVLARDGRPLAKLAATADEAMKQQLSLIEERIQAARELIVDEEQEYELRTAAVGLLARQPKRQSEDIAALVELLVPRNSRQLQSAVIDRLAQVDAPQIGGLLLSRWKTLGPRRRTQVLDTLIGRQRWTHALLHAVEHGNIARLEIDAVHRQQLLGHRTAEIREHAEKALAGLIDANRQRVLDDYQESLSRNGDTARGKQVFAKQCANCHKLEGVGHEVGPDLASLKDKSPESLLIALFDPNRNVESKYISYVAVTDAGRTFSGILSNETSSSITLLAAKGERVSLLRTELDVLSSTSKSAMPEGLEKELTSQQVADVTAYVRHVGRAHVPRNQRGRFARGVRPGKDGSLVLSASQCEIYGDTLVFESKHDNLGRWSSSNDRAIWPIGLPNGGRFDVWIDWACAKESAGNVLRIDCGQATLTHRVESTGSWDTYRSKKIGTLTLPEGAQRLRVRPQAAVSGALINLKSLRLLPVLRD